MDYEELDSEESYSDSALLDDPIEETGDTGAGETSLAAVASVGPTDGQAVPENSRTGDFFCVCD